MADTETKRAKVAEGAAQNDLEYRQLLEDSRNQMTMDTSDARREMFIDFMVEWGIVTEDQRLDFELAFNAKVADSLKEGFAQLREAKKQESKLFKPNRAARLVDGRGRPL